MKKFGQILVLLFALAFGYGLGQQSQDLFATDLPGGGGGTHPVNLASDVTGELPHGSTSDDAAQVHGLPANANVLGNLDASGEFIQRAKHGVTATMSVDTGFGVVNGGAETFATAFSAAPTIVATPVGDTDTRAVSIDSVSTTGFTPRISGLPSTASSASIHYIAVGT